jgi:cation:H+ antiporter
MSLILPAVIFIVGLAFLILSAKIFTQCAEVIGAQFGMSPFAIGVTIVSIGTSLPELVSAIISVQTGNSEIVAGNVLGSSLSNILLVLGCTAVFSPRRVNLGKQYLYIDLHFLIGAVFFVVITMYDGIIHVNEAFFGIITYVVYLIYLLKTGSSLDDDEYVEEDKDLSPEPTTKKLSWFEKPGIVWVTLLASGFAIFLSGTFTIDALNDLALGLGVSKAIISVTLLSIGTTLPECVVSISAARSGKPQIAVGNVLGSCIFNALTVPGVAACFGAIIVPAELLQFTLIVYVAASVFFYLITQDKKISAYEGMVLILIYGLFIGKISKLI